MLFTFNNFTNNPNLSIDDLRKNLVEFLNSNEEIIELFYEKLFEAISKEEFEFNFDLSYFIISEVIIVSPFDDMKKIQNCL